MSEERKEPLNRDIVLDTALQILDEQGVQKLTMRHLADQLNVYPTTIYWHAGNKEKLLALICRRILDKIQLKDFPGELSWDAWLLDAAGSIRAALREHPNVIPILSAEVQVSPSSFGFIDKFLKVLESAGFREEDIPDLYNTVIASIFGWVFSEFSAPPRKAEKGWEVSFRETLESADPQEFPSLHRHTEKLANRSFMLRWDSALQFPMDSSFTMAMRVMVGGLRQLLFDDDRVQLG